MLNSPDVGERCDSSALEEVVNVNLVQHSLDVWQSYLKRCVLAVQLFIDDLGELPGDNSLSVIPENINTLPALNTMILPNGIVASVVLNSDNIRVMNSVFLIIHNDYSVGLVDVYSVNTNAA